MHDVYCTLLHQNLNEGSTCWTNEIIKLTVYLSSSSIKNFFDTSTALYLNLVSKYGSFNEFHDSKFPQKSVFSLTLLEIYILIKILIFWCLNSLPHRLLFSNVILDSTSSNLYSVIIISDVVSNNIIASVFSQNLKRIIKLFK